MAKGMIVRLTEVGGGCYGMEMNVEKTKVMRISRQPFTVQITIHQKQLENVKYSNYYSSRLTHYRGCICEIKSRICVAKGAFNKKALFSCNWDLNFRKKLVKCNNWSIASTLKLGLFGK
jgi:hypothetical protein